MLDETLQGFFCLVVIGKFITLNHLTLQNTVKCFDIRVFFRCCYVCKLLSATTIGCECDPIFASTFYENLRSLRKSVQETKIFSNTSINPFFRGVELDAIIPKEWPVVCFNVLEAKLKRAR